MKKKVQLINILLVVFGLVLVFHFLVLMGIVPYEYVWGGRLNTLKNMYAFEGVSILLNVLVMLVLFKKRNSLITGTSNKVIETLLWILCFLFTLNTIGNLFAETNFEKWVFTPVTAILAYVFFILAKK